MLVDSNISSKLGAQLRLCISEDMLLRGIIKFGRVGCNQETSDDQASIKFMPFSEGQGFSKILTRLVL